MKGPSRFLFSPEGATPAAAPLAPATPSMVVVEAPQPQQIATGKPSTKTEKAADESRRSSIEKMFAQPGGPTPPVEAPPAPLPVKQEEPPVVATPPAQTPPKKMELEWSEDIDFDPDKPPVAPVATPKEEETPVPTAEQNDSQAMKTLREQLQIQGKRAKDLAAETQEKGIEIERLRAENARLQSELQSPKRVAADPFSHPEIAAEKTALVRNRDAFAMTLPPDQRKAFAGEFENMLGTFAQIANDSNPETQNRLIDELHEKIGSTIGDNMVPAVMQLLANNGDRYTSLIDKIQNFASMAEEMTQKEKVDEWSKKSGKIGALVSAINSLDDEVIEADPHTPAAYVAKLVKTDPAYAARSEQVKAVITEAFFGRRPLTKAEIKGLEEAGHLEGITVEDFTKAREKRVAKSQEDAVRRLYVAMMMAPDLPEMIKTTVKEKQQKKAAEEERLALISSTAPKKGEAPKPEEKYERAIDKPSAISRVLDKF